MTRTKKKRKGPPQGVVIEGVTHHTIDLGNGYALLGKIDPRYDHLPDGNINPITGEPWLETRAILRPLGIDDPYADPSQGPTESMREKAS